MSKIIKGTIAFEFEIFDSETELDLSGSDVVIQTHLLRIGNQIDRFVDFRTWQILQYERVEELEDDEELLAHCKHGVEGWCISCIEALNQKQDEEE